MVAMMVLSAVLVAQDPSHTHVRSTERMIRTLIEQGIARSATFRRLVETLDQSDVVVYIDPKITRDALGGYLSHDVLSAGGQRYLHIAVVLRGGDIGWCRSLPTNFSTPSKCRGILGRVMPNR